MKPRHIPIITTTAILIAITASPLTAQSVWTGVDGEYTEPTNWNPESAPGSGDEVVISSGTATLASGNLERAANTTLNGGNLVIANGRFLNNRPTSNTTFTVEAGSSFTHTGEYFIVAQQPGLGEFTQNGGTVTSTIDRGWGLSDGGSTRGRYIMNGGTLNVNLTGPDFNWEAVVGRASGGAGDLLEIRDGATANFSADAASTNRRFFISNRGVVRVLPGGELNADALRFFVVGRDAASGTIPLMHLDGGTFNVTDTEAFIVSNNGLFQLDSGTVTLSNTEFWLADGGAGNAAATVVQTGGTLTSLDQPLILSRASTRSGQYFLRGGNLEVPDITVGAGVIPKFFYESGTVTLTGDRTDIVDETFFFSFGDVSASYDGVSDTTTLSVTPATGFEHSYQHYRFTATELRSGLSTGTVQLAELELLSGGTPVDLSTVTITNPGGDNPAGQTPAELIDGDATTKWLDFNNAPIVIDFGATTPIDGYRLTTGNDASDRDPVRWTIEGSADGSTWEVIERVIDTGIMPTGRHITSLDIPLREDVAIPVLTWTGGINSDWDTTTLNWDELGQRAWENAATPFVAIFDSGAPTAVSLVENIRAGSLSFRAPGYTIGGGFDLELGGFGQIEALEDATIDADLTGNLGLAKSGDATLTFSGANPYTGATSILDGSLRYIGSGASTGGGALSMGAEDHSRTSLLIDTTGTLTYGGTALIGIGDSAAAVIRQTNGTLVTNGPGNTYFELGGSNAATAGSYGAYLLENGSYDSGGFGSLSGVRVGRHGHGVFHQTGGTADIARWFAIGGPGGSEGEGLTNLLGGAMTINPNYRILIGDSGSSFGTLNLGTQAGGNATLTTLNGAGLSVGQNTGTTSLLNLNAGTLTLGGPVFRNNTGSSGIVNLNGATLIAGADDIDLISSSLSAANFYNGGLTIDTAGNNARITAALEQPFGAGVYPAGGALDVTDGGTGYLAPPLVGISTDGFGSGLTAIAEVVGGTITRVLITSPGSGYEAGDSLTFTFLRGGPTTPAPDFVHTLTALDLEENNTGALVKTGLGTLDVQGEIDHEGDTLVLQGTLALNGRVGDTAIRVESNGTLTGELDAFGPVTIAGTFAPGNGVGTAQSFSGLTLEENSTLVIELADWNEIEGIGYDTMAFDSLTINATAEDKLTVRLDASGQVNFTEVNRSLLVASTFFGVSGLTTDNWQIDLVGFPGTGDWDLVTDNGDLRLEYTAGAGTDFDTWLAGFPTLTDTAPLADPDQDGIANVLEYILGGNPTAPKTATLPEAEALPNGDLVFSFVRRAASKHITTQIFQYSTNLADWSDVPVPGTSAGNVVIIADSPQVGSETVTITVAATNATDGRIFGRLKSALD